eukprot:684895-Amphidinium_carterae.1
MEQDGSRWDGGRSLKMLQEPGPLQRLRRCAGKPCHMSMKLELGLYCEHRLKLTTCPKELMQLAKAVCQLLCSQYH